MQLLQKELIMPKQETFFKNEVLRGTVVAKDKKPFFETSISVLNKETGKFEDHKILVPVDLNQNDKETLRKWHGEKKKNSSYMVVRYDANDPLNVEKYEQKQFKLGSENLKAQRAFYHYFASEKGDRSEVFLSVQTLPTRKKSKVEAIIQKNARARVSAFICLIDKDEKGKEVFYPIKGAACSPDRFARYKKESISAEDYMKKMDEKIKNLTISLAKGGLKGKPLAVFYSVEQVHRLDAYPNAETKEMNGFGKYIIDTAIPKQNKLKEETGKTLYWGDVLFTEGEKGGIFINKNYPLGIGTAANVMSYILTEITEAKKKELGIDEAEVYLQNVKSSQAVHQRSENFNAYNDEEVEPIICDDAEAITETLAEDDELADNPFGPSM